MKIKECDIYKENICLYGLFIRCLCPFFHFVHKNCDMLQIELNRSQTITQVIPGFFLTEEATYETT